MRVLVYTSLYPNNVFSHHGVFVKERVTNFSRKPDAYVRVVAPVPYFPKLNIGHWFRFSRVCRQETIDGVEIYHPRYPLVPKVSMVFHGALMALGTVSLLRRLQRQSDFDVLDAHFVYPDGFAAVLLGMWFRKPVVVSARGSDINRYMYFPFIRRLVQYTLMRAEAVVAVSQALKSAMIGLGISASKITVIPNGVDCVKFAPLPKQEARTMLGLPKEVPLIVSVGNLTSNKGFGLIVQAVKLLLDQGLHPDLSVAIIGDGAYRSKLQALVRSLQLQSKVILAGDIPHHELAPWYSAADVFCLASEMEGWPNVVMEALACGVPVVATPVGSIPEIIASDEVGLLTARNPSDIACAIDRALRRKWNPDQIRRRVQNYSWDNASDMMSKVFRAVVDRTNVDISLA